jgi:hypothetical protein
MCFSKFNLHVGERENAGLLEKPIYRTKPKDEDYPGISWSCYSAVRFSRVRLAAMKLVLGR